MPPIPPHPQANFPHTLGFWVWGVVGLFRFLCLSTAPACFGRPRWLSTELLVWWDSGLPYWLHSSPWLLVLAVKEALRNEPNIHRLTCPNNAPMHLLVGLIKINHSI